MEQLASPAWSRGFAEEPSPRATRRPLVLTFLRSSWEFMVRTWGWCCGTRRGRRSLMPSPRRIIEELRPVWWHSPPLTETLCWRWGSGGRRWRTSAGTSPWSWSRTRLIWSPSLKSTSKSWLIKFLKCPETVAVSTFRLKFPELRQHVSRQINQIIFSDPKQKLWVENWTWDCTERLSRMTSMLASCSNISQRTTLIR